jgi:hypothetical protein
MLGSRKTAVDRRIAPINYRLKRIKISTTTRPEVKRIFATEVRKPWTYIQSTYRCNIATTLSLHILGSYIMIIWRRITIINRRLQWIKTARLSRLVPERIMKNLAWFCTIKTLLTTGHGTDQSTTGCGPSMNFSMPIRTTVTLNGSTFDKSFWQILDDPNKLSRCLVTFRSLQLLGN